MSKIDDLKAKKKAINEKIKNEELKSKLKQLKTLDILRKKLYLKDCKNDQEIIEKIDKKFMQNNLTNLN